MPEFLDYEGLQEYDEQIKAYIADATADDILQGKTAYINGQKVSGTIGTISSEQIQALFEGE